MITKPLPSDAENPAAVEYLRKHNMSFQKMLQGIVDRQTTSYDRLVYESSDDVDESLGSALRTSALAAMLAIPGMLPAKTISRDVVRIKSNSPITMQNDEYRKAVNGENDPNVVRIGGYTAAQLINIIARTIFAEGNGETREGRLGIATTIYNRGKGNPLKEAESCIHKEAYSCWNGIKDRASYFSPKLYTNMPPSLLREKPNDRRLQSIWEESKAIATSMVNGGFTPLWRGENYTHYVTTALYRNPEKVGKWYYGKPGKVLGDHIFFTQAVADARPKRGLGVAKKPSGGTMRKKSASAQKRPNGGKSVAKR